MKNIHTALLASLLAFSSGIVTASSDTVLVIKKIGKDLYDAQNGPYIQTRDCEAFSYSETVVLKDNGLSKMWLVFSDGSVCEVIRLIKKGQDSKSGG